MSSPLSSTLLLLLIVLSSVLVQLCFSCFSGMICVFRSLLLQCKSPAAGTDFDFTALILSMLLCSPFFSILQRCNNLFVQFYCSSSTLPLLLLLRLKSLSGRNFNYTMTSPHILHNPNIVETRNKIETKHSFVPTQRAKEEKNHTNQFIRFNLLVGCRVYHVYYYCPHSNRSMSVWILQMMYYCSMLLLAELATKWRLFTQKLIHYHFHWKYFSKYSGTRCFCISICNFCYFRSIFFFLHLN